MSYLTSVLDKSPIRDGGTPERFAQFMASERVKYSKLVKDANVTIE